MIGFAPAGDAAWRDLAVSCPSASEEVGGKSGRTAADPQETFEGPSRDPDSGQQRDARAKRSSGHKMAAAARTISSQSPVELMNDADLQHRR